MPVLETKDTEKSASALVAEYRALLNHQPLRFKTQFTSLLPSQAAEIINRLSETERKQCIHLIRGEFNPQIFIFLSAIARQRLCAAFSIRRLAELLSTLKTNHIAAVLQDISSLYRRRILNYLSENHQAILKEVLLSPLHAAGWLMHHDYVPIPEFWTRDQTIQHLRHLDPEDCYHIVVVDPRFHPVGLLSPTQLLCTEDNVMVKTLVNPATIITTAIDATQEEVAWLFRRYDLFSAPVVDRSGRLIGIITLDDVVDVVHETTESDALNLNLLSQNDFHLPVWRSAFSRLRWLIVTVFNTIIASLVIAKFQDIIAHSVILAALMPIVAALGGNAGMQVVTITVRALATHELDRRNLWDALYKEVKIGLVNGTAIALFMGGLALIWLDSSALALTLMNAILFNIMWAASAGVLLPMLIDYLGFDPAISAGPLLTTTTDVLGFSVFLGFAQYFLHLG